MVSRILVSILADIGSALFWIVSIHLFWSLFYGMSSFIRLLNAEVGFSMTLSFRVINDNHPL